MIKDVYFSEERNLVQNIFSSVCRKLWNQRNVFGCCQNFVQIWKTDEHKTSSIFFII